MFPVAFEEIYYARPAREEAARQEPLFEGAAPMTRIGAWRAVVNEETGEALAVVSRGYHLVSNAEAFELGALCFQRLFETEDTSGMRVFNIVAPQSLTLCHVDL